MKTENLEEKKNQQKQDRLQWYVVHTASGHEGKVADTMRQRVESMELSDQVTEILVPTQKKIVVESGQKKEIKERLFPGYVMVKMTLNDDTWQAVRNTTGVTGFVGGGGRPTPLPQREVDAILRFSEMEAPKYEAKFRVGDSVRITDGPFADFLGKVEAIDEDKGTLTALVSVFGRETPIELEFGQVSPL
jgi:transcriptional antiterminator NusG